MVRSAGGRRSALVTGLPVLLLALVVATACVLLGMWQLDRLRQVRAANARVVAGRGAAPVVLDGAPGSGAAHRRASATGSYDREGEVVLFGRALDGRAGDHLLTPLRLADGSALLVDRGWVPTGERSAAPEGVVRVRGVLLPPESTDGEAPAGGRVTSVDPSGIERTLAYRLAPVYLLLRRQEPPPGELPIMASLPPLTEGPHLGYAIQWFSFAGVALAGGAILVRRSGRVERPVAR